MNGREELTRRLEYRIKKDIIDDDSILQGFYTYMFNASAATARNYLLHVKNFLKYTNRKPLEKLVVDDFTGFLMYMRVNPKNGELFTASYQQNIHQALKKFGEYLVVRGYQKENLMNHVPRPKRIESMKTIQRRENGYLTPDEIKLFLSEVDKRCDRMPDRDGFREYTRIMDKSILLVFLTTGIRSFALLSLNDDDVDLEGRKLIVTDKGNKVKTYQLSPMVCNTLKLYKKTRDDYWDGCCEEEYGFFIGYFGRRINYTYVNRLVQECAVNIKGKNITPHKLRATYGILLYNETKDIYFVQKCMNHASPTTTELYIRGVPDQTKEASGIIEKYL